jgi:hypothetical protein
MKKEIFNKVVNFENGEITVLDKVFDYDGMKGATGTIFEPVSREQYEIETSFENVKELLKDASELPKEYWDGGYNEWTQAIFDNNEEMNVVYDTSYEYLWDYLREELGLDEENAYIFDCRGGGRCFSKDYQGNVNPELSKVIREYES